jgi:uncharacterized protein (DUF2132 family)
MNPSQPNNPLHGLTLQAILETLVERHGWPELGARIKIRCFTHDPSVKSSLKFLRATPWARSAVEQLYLEDERRLEKKRERNRERAARRAHAAEHAPVAGAPGADGSIGIEPAVTTHAPEAPARQPSDDDAT